MERQSGDGQLPGYEWSVVVVVRDGVCGAASEAGGLGGPCRAQQTVVMMVITPDARDAPLPGQNNENPQYYGRAFFDKRAWHLDSFEQSFHGGQPRRV
jgi:hypothetical protein